MTIRLLTGHSSGVPAPLWYDAGMTKLTGRRRPLLPCVQCGSPILRAGTTPRFCGNECYRQSRKGVPLRPEVASARNYNSGSAHASWLGDSVSVRGGRTRAERLFPTIGPCGRCGAARGERHHIDGNTANNEASNIEALCRRCHMVEDGRLDRQIASSRERQAGAAVAAAAAKLGRLLCKNGHNWAVAGWRTNKSGARICKECERGYKARYLGKVALRCL
jgi:5-methylcytosine-specific restriction endonuclease McrA